MHEQLIGLWLAIAPFVLQGPPPNAPPRVSADVVVTATLSPVPESSVAKPVTVMTRAELETLGVTSAVDALRLAPGFDVRARGPRDVQADLSVRGATFGQQLVLADGVRTNDAQSGHHNGELPLPLLALDRVEIVSGAGSAVHGADALGGVINLITRTDRHSAFALSVGQHSLVSATASHAGAGLPSTWMATAWGQQSDGFTFDRDFAMGGGVVRGRLWPELSFDARHQRRAFGANGFYGASPSKEWTDLSLTSLSWGRTRGTWTSSVRSTWKNHGDHFRWDIARPGFAENRHRTNAGEVVASVGTRDASGRSLTVGAAADSDWVRSSNLGNHDFSRTSAFAELQAPLFSRAIVQAGVRADRYSTFGSQVSPSLSAVYASDAGWRVRGSIGRAFRVPTFTELYYLDPNNEGNPLLTAERGWSADTGVEYAKNGWSLALSPFTRWDNNVIDYVRPVSTVRWHAENVRDVTTRGIEASATRRVNSTVLRAAYTLLDVDAPTLTTLSKYVLEYARHSLVVSAAGPLGARGVHASATADFRNRLDGQRYTLVDARLSYAPRAWKRVSAYVDASNLLDANYHEVLGVAMPGRWMTMGITVR